MIPSSPPAHTALTHRDPRQEQILASQIRLLYGNSNIGLGVTLLAAPTLGGLLWSSAPHNVIIVWCLYMFSVAAARFALGRRYWRHLPSIVSQSRWSTAFACGAGLSGAGWGAAGVFLYPLDNLANQVMVVFILGGMMLGAASVLAARPEAFLAFMVPTGLAPAVRMVVQADEAHLAMGLLAGVFTIAILATTWRMHQTITSYLEFQFKNQDLVDGLRAANSRAEALNEQLEVRVQKRTADLLESTVHLRSEIAQREQVEAALLRARKLESLGVLAGGIAHDFNNFLTVVQGNIEMAKLELYPGHPAQPILEQTTRACQRAVFLSSQLLTFAKGGSPVRRLVSVARLVTDAADLARAGAPVSITVSMAEDLRCAEVDPNQIGQVLHNVLLNARQAMPEGGIIEVGAANAEREGAGAAAPLVRISIRDYGCGIPPDAMPRIFDPYFTTKQGGSGLGLATSYAIVAKHGGRLSAESKPGNGAVFTIELPASLERCVPEAPVVERMQSGTERLLVMDDEEALRKLLVLILSGLGYQVQAARDGAEAIALCEKAKAASERFDAILLDLTVASGMGGIEAAARLKELDPSLRLIVSSGYSDAPAMAHFREYGFDDVIPKPWVAADLSSVFRRVLAGDRVERPLPDGRGSDRSRDR